MRVMVAGGAGYIGSVVTKELLHAGHTAIVYDNLSQGRLSAVPDGAAFVRGDILDGLALRRALAIHQPEAVIHMAAHSLVLDSMQAPEKYYHNNLVGTLSLLSALNEADIKLLVFSSTAAVYGQPERQPIEETERLQPKNPYGETKLACERALHWYAQAHGLRFACLRYFNAAGASEECGERHDPETHLIPLILKAAMAERPEVTIFGTDYETPDGTCIRDYIHVLDLARAHLLALAALCQGQRSLVYNLGCGGSGYSVRQVLQVAQEITGREFHVHKGARRAGDPAVLLASPAKITAELGWRPQYQDLHAIVGSAWRWMQHARDL